MRLRRPPGWSADIKREKAERTDAAAREILEAEQRERDAKLKALRLAGRMQTEPSD